MEYFISLEGHSFFSFIPLFLLFIPFPYTVGCERSSSFLFDSSAPSCSLLCISEWCPSLCNMDHYSVLTSVRMLQYNIEFCSNLTFNIEWSFLLGSALRILRLSWTNINLMYLGGDLNTNEHGFLKYFDLFLVIFFSSLTCGSETGRPLHFL